jgi:hypothetical protein
MASSESGKSTKETIKKIAGYGLILGGLAVAGTVVLS